MLKWALGLVLIFTSVFLPFLWVGLDKEGQVGILMILMPSLFYTFIGGILFSIIYFIHARIWQASWSSMLISVSVAIYLNSLLNFIMHWPGASFQRYSSIVLLLIGIGYLILNMAKKKEAR